jgi:SAM-dependent methyltransferase
LLHGVANTRCGSLNETANSDASQQLTELCMSLYHDRADDFFRQYQSVAAEKVHASWLAVLDTMPAGHALDVGAGSGRDARYLASRGWSVVAVEPADALRERAMQLPVAGLTWLADALPELSVVYRLQTKFDLIVLSAVWMHIAPSARSRTLRKLAGLLKPGGKLIVTLRHGEFTDGRTAYPVSFAELKQLADAQALQATLLNEPQADELGRQEVSWQTVLLTLPDDGSGAFALLRHIVINDNKASSYKLGLLRSLLRIAEGHPGAVLEQTEQQVVLPLGLVAFYWLKLYRPLTENFRLFPNSDANKGRVWQIRSPKSGMG